MSGRGYTVTSGYRYGFNGQEKDDEVSGAGNSYGAEFWEYSPRLGRRWNIDPKVKVWLSSYSAFSNNPLIYVDPQGDDDFFNTKGEYVGCTPEGSMIRIVNDNVTFDQAKENIPNNTLLLSQYNYCPENKSNISMLESVTNYYTPQSGIEDHVSVGYKSKAGVAAFFTPADKSFHIAVNENTGLINPALDQFSNLINSFAHEKDHKDHPETGQNLFHTNSIVKQSEHGSFDNTTKEYKQALGNYAVSLLNKALIGGASEEAVNKQIDAFNSSKLGESVLLLYDKTTNKVSSMNLENLKPVDVKPSKSSNN
jgi:RHS repeat-associated protein